MDQPVTSAVRPDPEEPTPWRKAWLRPEVSDLPRLTELTLQTGDPIWGGGGTGGGGSTVF